MNIIATILSVFVLFLRIFVVIKVGILLLTYFFNDSIEISRTFYLLISYMIFDQYIFRSFENNENSDIYHKKDHEES